MKVTKEVALILVQEKLDKETQYMPPKDYQVVVWPEVTIEKEAYFVIFYNSDTCIRSGDLIDGLVGNAPYIVDKATGDLYSTGTADPIEHYMAEYEAGRIDKEE